MIERVSLGDAIKALDPAKRRVGGYVVRWGSPTDRDLTNEYFTAKTDFWGRDQAFGIFDHGLDDQLQSSRVGEFSLKADAVGLWGEGELRPVGSWAESVAAKADQYLDEIYRLVADGKLGWSSGSSPYLARVAPTGEIKTWPIVEISLTPTPAEFRNRVTPLKSLLDARAGTKAGRVLSTVNWQMFDQMETGMRSHLNEIRAFLDQYKPDAAGAVPAGEADMELEQRAQATLLLL